MITWKQYYPDVGLIQVIALDRYEHDKFTNYLYSIAKSEDELLAIRPIKEKREPFKLDNKIEWHKVIFNKYNINEDLGLIATENFLKNDEIFMNRYNKAMEKLLGG